MQMWLYVIAAFSFSFLVLILMGVIQKGPKK